MQRSAWMRGSCLLGRHPCRTQAAGERYPTHLADAATYAEFAGHREWISQTISVMGVNNRPRKWTPHLEAAAGKLTKNNELGLAIPRAALVRRLLYFSARNTSR
jgi:hypothetical protein